ncbi:MAG: exodeoxyribonuclease VII small subunit [Lactobacillus sp.]|jgi:exodeoxyribonuclease VII small subunit|nr:exodeoxyribonuclease VII small subunit [Lactobacillus sp.]
MTKQASFEENLENLEQIVANLEQGDIPLEKALSQFQEGVKLSQSLEKTLTQAQATLTKVMTDTGDTADFEPQAPTTDQDEADADDK